MSLAIRASSGKPYDPKLMLNKEAVPYIGDSTFHFLGAPVSLHSTSMQARESLLEKLRALLQKVDATLVTRQQKLKLYKVARDSPGTFQSQTSLPHGFRPSSSHWPHPSSRSGAALPSQLTPVACSHLKPTVA